MTEEKSLLDKIRDGEPGWQEELKEACLKYGPLPGDYDGDPIVKYDFDSNTLEDAMVISESVAALLCKGIKMEKIPAYRRNLKRQRNRQALYEKRKKLGRKL